MTDLRALVEQKRSLCNRLAASGANLPAPFTAEEALALLDALAGAEKRVQEIEEYPRRPEPTFLSPEEALDYWRSETLALDSWHEHQNRRYEALEARLSKLQELGRRVVEEAQKGCSIHEVWDNLEAALKALKAEINKEGV